MSSFAQGILQDLAIDKFNETAEEKTPQKDPYSLPPPQGLSKRDADILRRCKRRAHQLDHNAVMCYCCPCFFGLNTAICMVSLIPPVFSVSFRLGCTVPDDLNNWYLSRFLRRLALDFFAYSWLWGFILGLIPIIGPIWANSLSGRVIKIAEEADIPATLTAKMTANITFDFLVSTLHLNLFASPFFHLFHVFPIYAPLPSVRVFTSHFASFCLFCTFLR